VTGRLRGGWVAGEAIDGVNNKNFRLDTQTQGFIPGFVEALSGLSTGAEKTFELVFPEDWYIVRAWAHRPRGARCLACLLFCSSHSVGGVPPPTPSWLRSHICAGAVSGGGA
jgi:Pyruvate/2-oxoacid:ferredoxin oxidoreductase delta subunit